MKPPIILLVFASCGGIAIVDGEPNPEPDPSVCTTDLDCCEQVIELEEANCPTPNVETVCSIDEISAACRTAVEALNRCVLAATDAVICNDDGHPRLRCSVCQNEQAATDADCPPARPCL